MIESLTFSENKPYVDCFLGVSEMFRMSDLKKASSQLPIFLLCHYYHSCYHQYKYYVW